MNRHLLSAADLDRDEAVHVLDTAEEIAGLLDRADRTVKKLPTLRGRTVVNLFFEDSTRTRISFEAAAKRLSADVINFAAKGSSLSKGESLKDTALTLEAMGADAVVIRHPASGAPHRLARSGWVRASVVNAGDGTHEHPTQALLDAFTIREHKGRIEGLNVAIIGDLFHSRVFRSNAILLNRLGAHVRVCAPATLLPPSVERFGVTATTRIDEALEGADVVMMLRIQQERMHGHFFPNTREYFEEFGLTLPRLRLAKHDAIVMHPGPMNRGVEIASEVADGPFSVILEQAANGVAVRMAVLYLLAGGAEEQAA